MTELLDIPQTFQKEQPIIELFDVAEFLKLTADEKFSYQQDLKARLDYINVMRYAKEMATQKGMQQGLEKGLKKGLQKGREEGRKEEKLAIAQKLLDILDDKTIALKTELTIEDIKTLRTKEQK